MANTSKAFAIFDHLADTESGFILNIVALVQPDCEECRDDNNPTMDQSIKEQCYKQAERECPGKHRVQAPKV